METDQRAKAELEKAERERIEKAAAAEQLRLS